MVGRWEACRNGDGRRRRSSQVNLELKLNCRSWQRRHGCLPAASRADERHLRVAFFSHEDINNKLVSNKILLCFFML